MSAPQTETLDGLVVHREMLQGSEEWYAARRGMLTASVIGALLTTKPPAATEYSCPQCDAIEGEPCWSKASKTPTPIKTLHTPRIEKAAANPDGLPDRIEVVTGDTANTLLAAIVAERLTDWEDPAFETNDMARGHQVEPVARDWYAERQGVEVEQVGFMVRDLGDGVRLGYSPDGLVGDDGLIEIKAPRAKKHVLTHIDQQVPAEHIAQCQAGMFVAGRSWVDFISYVGGEPPFVKRIEADQSWFAAIEKSVAHFEEKAVEMQAAYASATAGLPSTDRLPDPYDVELRIA